MLVHKKLTGTEQIFNNKNDKGSLNWRNAVKISEEHSYKEYTTIVTWNYNSEQEHYSLFCKAG